MMGGLVTVDAIGVTETVIDSDSFQGAVLDSDLGEVGISLGDLDDRSGVGTTIEGDIGSAGIEATSTGELVEEAKVQQNPSIWIVLLFVLAACQTTYQDKPMPIGKEVNSPYERTAHIQFLKSLADSCKDKGKSGSVYADNLVLWTDYPEYLDVIGQIEGMTSDQKNGDWLVKQELAYDRGVCAISLYQSNAQGLKLTSWDCRKSSAPTVKYNTDNRTVPTELISPNTFECHSNFDHQKGMISFFGEVDGQQVSRHQIKK